MAKSSSVVDLEPLNRLEEKVQLLIATVDRMRSEHARVTADNQRLTRELDTARERLAQTEGAATEMLSLKEERDVIRTRVSEMLGQLEALNL